MAKVLEKGNVRPKRVQELKALLKPYGNSNAIGYVNPEEYTNGGKLLILLSNNETLEDEFTTEEAAMAIEDYPDIKKGSKIWKASSESIKRFHNTKSGVRRGQRRSRTNIVFSEKVRHPDFDHLVWVIRSTKTPEQLKKLLRDAQINRSAWERIEADIILVMKTPPKQREKNANEFLSELLRKPSKEDTLDV